MQDSDYAHKLQARTQQLIERLHTINKQQREQAFKQRVLYQSSQETLYQIREDLATLDTETRMLANKVKKLIASLRRVAMQEQMQTLEQKSDFLAIDEWVTKKEVKKIVTSSFYGEENQ